MSCDFTNERLSLYLYGELSPEEEEKVEQHLHTCPACQDALAVEKQLFAFMEQGQEEPPAHLLADCRRALREQLPAAPPKAKWWESALESFRLPSPVWKFAAVAGLLAIGFSAGRWQEQWRVTTPENLQTARVRTVQGRGDGTVQIVLEEPRQRIINGDLNEDSITRLLFSAAREASDPSLRVESVDLLRNRGNRDDVRQLLLRTAEADPNPSVRLKAVEALRPYTTESEVRQSLSRVLLQDLNPNVRVQAIEVLADRRTGDAQGRRDIIGTCQSVIRREDNDYIRQRCLRALGEMRASPGIF
jgi:hypothetical protein